MDTLPQEWTDHCRVFNAEIQDLKPSCAESIRAKLALRGGPVVGYRWAGNYRITLISDTAGRGTAPTVHVGYARTIEQVRRVIDKAKPSLALTNRRCMIITYYRDMLADKRVSKRHQKIIRAKFPTVRDAIGTEEGQLFTIKLLTRLLIRRGWEELIDGWHSPDGRVFDDIGWSGKIGWVE